MMEEKRRNCPAEASIIAHTAFYVASRQLTIFYVAGCDQQNNTAATDAQDTLNNMRKLYFFISEMKPSLKVTTD